jgi:MSHA biogenesis protein MshO
MISTLDGARYREQLPGTTDQILDFTTADTSFNVIGAFTEISKPFSSTSHYLVIYNVGVPGANAYELSNVITPPGTQINIAADTVAGEDRITLSPAFRFSYGSPVQRVFLVDGPISYLCDSAAGTLTRYSSYSIAGNHADRDSHGELVAAGANFGLIADRLASCTFNYAPGSAERAGMLSMNVRVSEQGETVALLAQVHVDNVP